MDESLQGAVSAFLSNARAIEDEYRSKRRMLSMHEQALVEQLQEAIPILWTIVGEHKTPEEKTFFSSRELAERTLQAEIRRRGQFGSDLSKYSVHVVESTELRTVEEFANINLKREFWYSDL